MAPQVIDYYNKKGVVVHLHAAQKPAKVTEEVNAALK